MSFDSAKFKAGQGGRVKGSRNRIAYKLIEALEKDFEEFGDQAIKICRMERPGDYLRIICSVIPKELEFTDSRLQDLTDDELTAIRDHIKQQLAEAALGSGIRTSETAH